MTQNPPPESWELATPVYGIRYPRPTAPAKRLPDAFTHIGTDLENALLSGPIPPGLNYKTGTKAERLAATPVRDQVWIETDTGAMYIGTGTVWMPISGAGGAAVALVTTGLTTDYPMTNAWGTIWGGTPDVLSGIAYEPSNGIATIQTAGLYRLDGRGAFNAGPAGDRLFRITRNGVVDPNDSVATDVAVGVSQLTFLNVQRTMRLNVGDTIRMQGFSATATTLRGAQNIGMEPRLSILRVGG